MFVIRLQVCCEYNQSKQDERPIALTIAIDVLVALVSELVHVGVLLVVVLDSAAVITGVAEVVLVHVALVHVGH